jgi:hypothetical protein
MTGRKKIGVFLVVAGVLLLAASGFLWQRQSPELGKLQAKKTTLEDSLTRVHAQLVKTSLKSRALQESQSQIPDTLRMTGAGQMMNQGNAYNKIIRKLEFTERDIKIDLAAIERKTVLARTEGRRTAIPAAAGGAAMLLTGLVLTALPGRRVGA